MDAVGVFALRSSFAAVWGVRAMKFSSDGEVRKIDVLVEELVRNVLNGEERCPRW